MEYGNPAGFALAMMAYHDRLRELDDETRDNMLAARTMWEQQIQHWSNPILDPMVSGAILGMSVGRAIEDSRESLDLDDEAVDQTAIAHLYCIWRIRMEAEHGESLPPDPFGDARQVGAARRLVARVIVRLLLRLLRTRSRV